MALFKHAKFGYLLMEALHLCCSFTGLIEMIKPSADLSARPMPEVEVSIAIFEQKLLETMAWLPVPEFQKYATEALCCCESQTQPFKSTFDDNYL